MLAFSTAFADEINISVIADEIDGITVSSDVAGFEIEYSINEDFEDSKKEKTEGNEIKLMNLNSDCVYFVRARIGDGPWSEVKYVVTKPYYEAFITGTTGRLYKKKSTGASYIKEPRMTKVKVYGKSSSWCKVKYSGSWYYMKKDKLTKCRDDHPYVSEDNSRYQQAVIDMAMHIYNDWDTRYVFGAYNSLNGNVHEMDCSGFATYVYNSVFQTKNPLYRVPHNTEDIYSLDVMYNKGKTGEFRLESVSEMKPGDLILFNSSLDGGNGRHANHCGIYLGNGDFIQSTRRYGKVVISTVSSYENKIVKVVRPIPEKVTPVNRKYKIKRDMNIYPAATCYSGTKKARLKKGTAVTLKYTRTNRAYVTYSGGKGYVLDYSKYF